MSSTAPSDLRIPPATILVVDDEPFNRDLLSQELEELGHLVMCAVDGAQALECLTERDCDLVLLDIMMPVLDGFGVLERLRAEGRLGALPVVVISALDDTESVARCLELGAEDHLVKPFDHTVLKARIDSTLEKKRLRDQLARQLELTRDVFGMYVPESVADAILNGHGIIAPMQTTATVLYCDIEGFTTVVERLSPERLMEMLNAYFAAMIEPIRRHGGVLNQFQGDAMLVTFNVPVAQPSHADHAVRTAIEMQAALREQRFAGERLRSRIGVNTGPVVAGNVGSGDRLHYTVHGDAVNVAARLEALNKLQGTRTLISGSTAVLLEASYPLRDLGEIRIRGRETPLVVHEVVPA